MTTKAYYEAHSEEDRRRSLTYYEIHRENVLAKQKAYYEAHREEIDQRHKAYNKEHREEINQWRRTFDGEHREEIRRQRTALHAALRMEVLQHYGAECTCCGETELKFLSIDHIDGGGNAHRREIGRGHIYRWLRKNNYPDGFQVLCHNCNLAKGFYGVCPHQEKKI